MAKIKGVVLLPSAKRDLNAGYRWYEEQKRGLGKVFLNRVEECLKAIRRSPKAFQPIGNDRRRAVVKQFPYVVFYRIEHNIVYIYAIFHTAQDPKKWMQRFDD